MKTLLLILCLIVVCFADNVMTLQGYADDLVYRPNNIFYPNDLKPLYTTPAENNDTAYTVVKKDKSYLIIRKYTVIDTVEVQKK